MQIDVKYVPNESIAFASYHSRYYKIISAINEYLYLSSEKIFHHNIVKKVLLNKVGQAVLKAELLDVVNMNYMRVIIPIRNDYPLFLLVNCFYLPHPPISILEVGGLFYVFFKIFKVFLKKLAEVMFPIVLISKGGKKHLAVTEGGEL